MKYNLIRANKLNYPICLMCNILGLSKSGFYRWNKRGFPELKKNNYDLIRKIELIHLGSRKSYGSPRVFKILKGMGEKVSENTVAKIMKENGIKAKSKRKFRVTTDSKHNLAVAPNLLARNFKPIGTNIAWCGDITYIQTNEGWLYLAVVLDLYSRKVVGWSMSDRMKKKLVLDAQTMAINRRDISKGLIFHSDRGSQYCSGDFKKLLSRNKIRLSMSRKGNCWDNAVAESFFSSLKKDLVFHEEFETRNEAKRKIFEWIEIFYNRERIHSTLDFKSPNEYELESA